MADCFSLPNVEETCHELLAEAKKTADTINKLREENEKLKAENEKLKAERDAAMRTIPHDCNTCSKDCDITIAHKALLTKRCDNWEWRGVQPDETCTSCSLDALWEQIEKKNGGC